MSTALAGRPAPAITGYHLDTEQTGALVFARLFADTGELAASGQAAIVGAFATFDQIVTAETHRRKGLGRYIMAVLSQCAQDCGATQGVLVATEAGAALYKTLGWSMVSPVTAASVLPDEDG
ncbi:GNAT family N-acetyltransferase [Gallaecimonas kandeliae]|uniref:GNAT family N-acetyltransferase n=1 Tax=Gallaecimonas kandeliae TaxID=3029055 RepID=UPI0026484529|nr:GNAT family N-acetyltransferase [Gallaecimonas kandeliae]WKE64040.1 GNAT family N-acetyltransferase [Gallaecimonas kandeliae]